MKDCPCGPPCYECVADDEVLTQLDERDGGFRSKPRLPGDGGEMSLLRGRLDSDEAEAKVRRIREGGRQVRHVRAAVLREAGFGVVHTPTKGNKGHCSIVWPGEPPYEFDTLWPDSMAEAFDGCFTEEIEEMSESR